MAPVPFGKAANSSREWPPGTTPGEDRSIPRSICQNLFMVTIVRLPQRERPTQVANIDSIIRRTSNALARSRQISRPVGEKRLPPSPRADAISTSSGSSSDLQF